MFFTKKIPNSLYTFDQFHNWTIYLGVKCKKGNWGKLAAYYATPSSAQSIQEHSPAQPGIIQPTTLQTPNQALSTEGNMQPANQPTTCHKQ